ncbi:MAG: DNA replication/repair protein RecF, partial [Thermoleophilaceae bacterium]
MRVTAVSLRDFRNYERAEVAPGDGLTVLVGPNGAGKTNLLEALYFWASGRSCRTSNERECVRAGQRLTRVVLDTEDDHGDGHRLEVGFAPGEPKHMRVDGAPVERLSDSTARPLVSVFLPDRLELVKGAPALRRAHLDQVVTALRPSRAATRAAYSRALAQRNALIARVRAGHSSSSLLAQWDTELARHGLELMSDRRAVVGELEEPFTRLAAELGLPRAPE